jgi:hypothetical protein
MANVKLKNDLQDPNIKPGPTNKLKAIKRAMNSFDQTIGTTQKSGTHAFKTLNTTNTICAENYEYSSQIQVRL